MCLTGTSVIAYYNFGIKLKDALPQTSYDFSQQINLSVIEKFYVLSLFDVFIYVIKNIHHQKNKVKSFYKYISLLK